MFSMAKFSKPWLILGLLMVASAAFAVKIDLPKDTIIVEAENGKMDKGVTLIDDKAAAEASEGKATDHARDARTVHDIEIPKAGDWYVWIRMFSPNGGADSYWIGIEKAEPNPHDAAGGEGAVKIYSEAGDSVNIAGHALNIWYWDSGVQGEPPPNRFFKVKTAGKYKLWSKGREPGTLLDQILLTPDEKFNAEEASKGAAIDIPRAVDAKTKLAVTWGRIKVR
jgi:hypothetical protein